jgi:hypothetical protein
MSELHLDGAYSIYKPLRNQIRKLDRRKSLYALWAYGNHLQFSSPFPSDVEFPPEFEGLKEAQKRALIPEWDLEVLARELIVEGSNFSDYSLMSLSKMSGTENKLKDVENSFASLFIEEGNNEMVLREFFRIKHRQFPWLARPLNPSFITRYYKIYKDNEMASIVQSVTGLDVKTHFRLGVFFCAISINHFAIKIEDSMFEKVTFTKDQLQMFLDRYSLDISILKEHLKDEKHIDETYLYRFHNLRKYPIIRDGDEYICPFPTLLYWRFISGLYYDLIDSKAWDKKAFGSSYEKYIGSVIKARLSEKSVSIISEEKYGGKKKRKDTVDWRVQDSQSLLFIECKTRRILAEAKEVLFNDDLLDMITEQVSEMLLQIYKTLHDYLEGRYPQERDYSIKAIYPILVTLEDWMVTSSHLSDRIREKLVTKLNSNSLPAEYITEYPYTITDTHGFELLMIVLAKHGIADVMSGKVLGEAQGYDLSLYIKDNWSDSFKAIDQIFQSDTSEVLSIA